MGLPVQIKTLIFSIIKRNKNNKCLMFLMLKKIVFGGVQRNGMKVRENPREKRGILFS
jgi:hypothetical protein